MPTMSGVEFMEELRRMASTNSRLLDSKFFVCSAESLPKSAEVGFTDSIEKPVSIKILQSLLAKEGFPIKRKKTGTLNNL